MENRGLQESKARRLDDLPLGKQLSQPKRKRRAEQRVVIGDQDSDCVHRLNSCMAFLQCAGCSGMRQIPATGFPA